MDEVFTQELELFRLIQTESCGRTERSLFRGIRKSQYGGAKLSLHRYCCKSLYRGIGGVGAFSDSFRRNLVVNLNRVFSMRLPVEAQ